MDTTLRLAPHIIRTDAQVIEIWWGDRLVGQVTGIEGHAGVRVISKYLLKTEAVKDSTLTSTVEVRVRG